MTFGDFDEDISVSTQNDTSAFAKLRLENDKQ
jgi:hypothetical protein